MPGVAPHSAAPPVAPAPLERHLCSYVQMVEPNGKTVKRGKDSVEIIEGCRDDDLMGTRSHD